MSRRVSIPHVPALDGLRGMAVAGVLLFHGGHLTGGYLGVDLFFVLSGFLITSLLLAESSSSGHIALGGFWARRARRLLPALGGLLIGIALYCLLIATPDELARIRGDALATIGYVANWRSVFSGQDYWALFLAPSPLEHTWSLAIEEQFYLVWPLVFVGLLTWWKTNVAKAVLVTSLLAAAASTALMVALHDPNDVSRAYYGTDTRATGILLGAALAAWLVIWGPVRSRTARIGLEVIGLAGIAVLALAWTGLDGQDNTLYRGGFLVCGLAAIAVIAAAAHPHPGPIARVLSFKPLCALGLISYGVYLWHWPVDIVANAQRTGLDGWTLFTLQCAITLTIAITSYQLLEMPIRRGALTRRQWTILTPAVATSLILLVILTTAGAQPANIAAASSRRNIDGPTVLIVGDSVPHTMVSGLQNQGFNAVDGGISGCRLLRGEIQYRQASKDCRWQRHWRRLLNREQPEIVMLILPGWDLFDTRPYNSENVLVPGTKAWNELYENRLVKAINLLGSRGARVVVPTMPCYGILPADEKYIDRSGMNPNRVRAANASLKRVAAKEPDAFTLPDLHELLCPKGQYQRSLGSVATVRTDGVHFSPEGSDLVGAWLAPQLQKTG
jgi:peptidoglycan/LPS O-acetylase OafA/YrhL/lysophospholipase L1-like esterase